MVLAFALAFYSVGYAITSFYSQVTGIGNSEFTDETTVTSMVIVSPTKIQVKLTSTADTVAGQTYYAALYLNGNYEATQTTSWTTGQIPGTTKTLSYSGLSLGIVTSWGINVTK